LPKLPWRKLLAGTLTGLVAAVGLHACLLLLRDNFHVVVPGRVYRSSQMAGPDLEEAIRRQGIRTVINLRGLCPDLGCYIDECRVTQNAGVSLVDFGFSAGRLPPVNELRYLVQTLDRCEYPILLHCRQGVDRTGLVSALVLLLHTNTDLDEAVGQLGLRFGHLPFGRTGYMERFFEVYREYLAAKNLHHSRDVFRHWLEVDYCAGACCCVMEPVDVPVKVPANRPWAARFKVRNSSAATWHMSPVPSADFHMGYLLINEQFGCAGMGRAGLFRAEVAPGQSIEITAALPALAAPGKYTLVVDMVDELQGWFYQHGCEPFEWHFEVQ
jgi:protein tyrosine phosphatase (PTP) superfamily phosphohydrolase (DUF442 family)